MLNLKLISEHDWASPRSHQYGKLYNLPKLLKFNSVLNAVKYDYTGTIAYFKVNKRSYIPQDNLLEYTENSPIFHFFKLIPNRYYIADFPDDNLWRTCDIDTTVYQLFSNTNKYTQPEKQFVLDKPYILFPLQSNNSKLLHSFMPDIFIRTILWAKATKTYILFKAHPFTTVNSHIYKYWDYLKAQGHVSDYSILVPPEYNVDYLVHNAEQVWTFSSGVGMQAAIVGKPVAHFWRDVDFFPLSTFAKTPEDAILSTAPSAEDRHRFLTWYFKILTINADSPKLELKIRNRLEKYFAQKHREISKIL